MNDQATPAINTVVHQVLALGRLARPGNVAMAGLGVVIGALVVGATEPTLDVVLATVATMLVVAGGNAFNDIADVETDRLAHPTRPLPSGVLSVPTAVGFAVACLLVAFILAVFVSIPVLLLVLGAEAVLVAYEVHLKASGLVGNLVVALLVGATFVAGALAVGRLTPTLWALAALATLANLGREVWKDCQDASADADRRTLAQVRGTRTARAVAITVTLAAVLLSPLPWLVDRFGGAVFLGLVLVADAAFVGAMLQRDAGHAQRFSKLGMLLALAAFAAGALL